MTNKLMFILLAIVSIGCQQTQQKEQTEPIKVDPIQSKFENYLFGFIDDPGSYEFVSLKIIDTISYKNTISKHRAMLESMIEEINDQHHVRRLRELNEYERATGFNLDSVQRYLYHYKYRANNQNGALQLFDLYVETDPEHNIKSRHDNYVRLYVHLAKLPGFDIE